VLAALTQSLAAASDAEAVIGAAFAQVGAVWRPREAVVAVWSPHTGADARPPVVHAWTASRSWDDLDAHVRQGLIDTLRRRDLTVIDAGDRPDAALGVGAPLDPENPSAGCLWLQFDKPRALEPDDRALLRVVAGLVGQAIARARMFDAQRSAATILQRSILGPTELPIEVSARYQPAVRPFEVGGDWYDVVNLADGRLGLVVGDCVGRGLEAAAVMDQLRTPAGRCFCGPTAPERCLRASTPSPPRSMGPPARPSSAQSSTPPAGS
jgi:hypothetical protein